MKKYLSLLFIFCLYPGIRDPVPETPSGLMVEFIRDPGKVKILDLKPEFSWIVSHNSKSQAACQILVSSSRENLERNFGDTWDSKKTEGSISSEVEYGGNELIRGRTYFWKVRIWDNRNKPTGYSGIESFTTGYPDGYSTTPERLVSNLVNPEKLIKLNDSHFFIDFGKDAFGTIILEVEPARNDTVIVHLGEKIAGANMIDKNPGGSIRYQKILLPLSPGTKKYTLKLPADKRNTGPSAIRLPDTIGIITPFRYCELENFRYELTPEKIHQKTINIFFDDDASSFTSSDTVLNQVWNICKYSIKATSFAGIYIDGDRERIPYEADAYINQLGHYYTDREYSMARITNEYFISHPTWPTEWILHTVLMFYNDFMFTGNIESVRNHYNELKNKTLASLAREDGLISVKNVDDEIMKSLGFTNSKERIRDIVDWPPAQKDTGWKLATPEGERDGYDMVEINSVVNAFYFRNLVLMSKLAGYLGKKADSVYYSDESKKVKDSFNKKLLDKTSGVYVDGENSHHSSLHANMMALAFDLVPENYLKSVTEFIKSRGMACSVYGSQYLLEGLYRAGEADYAFNLLTATNERSWWNMIRSGSTITMEAWDMKYKPNSDWNHAWGASPANIIPGYMWGIAPAGPGYSKAIIKPQLGGLKQSKIKVPTIRGSIFAEFTDTGNSKEYLITLPGNMDCDFIVPLLNNNVIVFNGKKSTPRNNCLKLRPGRNIITIV